MVLLRAPEVEAMALLCAPEEEEMVLHIARRWRTPRSHLTYTRPGYTCPQPTTHAPPPRALASSAAVVTRNVSYFLGTLLLAGALRSITSSLLGNPGRPT